MTRCDGYPEGDAATLNDARQKPLVSRRRIEHLKALAYDCGLTAEEARKFGKLTATKTWESLLTSHGLEFEPKIETSNNTVATAFDESPHQINLIDWIDWAQALTLALASVGLALLIVGRFPRINPLQLPQVKITIQIGEK
ncbi:hypothetical protein AVDCRST_MAG84-6282 [uncultured Microcoleus sp.]|uniref:Uncharacterized protein n=1 Tax=uncultured Microcoleus sp. TaxID=259945 RepID=A0A6J4P6I6_9CYAN|nr:hypothetical protein AVDCRST_MAG84-6282 [uncultured Microcoleus sp.]